MKIPEPKVGLALPIVNGRLLHLRLQEAIPQLQDPTVSRLKRFRQVVSVLVEEAILAVEKLSAPGEEKKAYARERAMRWIRAAEERYDLLPAAVEPAALYTLEKVLGIVTERIFTRLDAAGKVNAA